MGLSPAERIVLAVDTSDEQEAERLVSIAKGAGASYVKLGLELSTATSWGHCSDLAADYDIEWIADAKLDDIPATVAKSARNIADHVHTPFGITMDTKAGIQAMELAQETAEHIIMFGVTELTSIPAEETYKRYGVSRDVLVSRLSRQAATAGLLGLVASGREVRRIKTVKGTSGLLTLIPGTRSLGTVAHDQQNVVTPAEAIRDGADLLVIGRQITEADEPRIAFLDLVEEITEATNGRI